MRKSGFVALVAAFATVVAIATVLGLLAAPDPTVTDPRRSTRLSGPHGASGLAATVERLGAKAESWELPFFRLDSASLIASARTLVILEPSYAFAESELRGVAAWLGARRDVFTAGATGLERCFGVRVFVLPPTAVPRRQRKLTEAGGLDVREARAVFRPARVTAFASRPSDCDLFPLETGRRSALSTVSGDTVAMSVTLEGGATVILLADSRYVSNEDLRETDAGVLIVPLLLSSPQERTFLFDNFHHGFGPQGSMTSATLSWMARTPLGWAMLQLAFVGLLMLAARAVRFGPALEVVHRERRSPLDHVDALATGLARARRDETTVTLLVDGLRRRLGRPAGSEHASAERLAAWLDTLKLVTRTDAARSAVDRLKALLSQPADKGQVLEAARTVEELWQALQPKTISARS